MATILVQVGAFLGLGGIVGASVIVFLYFRTVAKSLDDRAEKVIGEKNDIVDESISKSLPRRAGLKYARALGRLLQEKRIDMNAVDMIIGLITTRPNETGKILEELERSKLPKEAIEMLRLDDEDKKYLFEVTSLWHSLRESVPHVYSELVDKITKGTISAIALAVFVGAVDLVLQYNFETTLIFLGLFILVAFYYYLTYGILGIRKLTELEKLLKKLEKAETLSDIREVSEEILK